MFYQTVVYVQHKVISKQKLNYSWNRKHKYNVMFVISDSRLNMAKACVYLIMSSLYSLASVNTVKSMSAEMYSGRVACCSGLVSQS